MWLNNVSMIVLSIITIVLSQGGNNSGVGTGNNNGIGTITKSDTLPDTAYYKSDSFTAKEKIYSITYYNANQTVREYRVFYINGQLSWYCQYDYVNKICSKERYYDPSNQMTFYATYESNTIGGKDYKYYNKNNILLSVVQYSSLLSALDSSWQCKSSTVYTVNNQIYSRKFYEYTPDGWLNKEIYLNNKNDTTGTGTWGYDPLSKLTSYTYTCKNNTSIHNSISKFTYNKYRYYYHDTNKNPDSLITYNNDKLLYTSKYDYDSRGWLTKERLYDKSGVAIFRGEYYFDKSNYSTTFKYYKEPLTLLFTNVSDYTGLLKSSDYYTGANISNSLKYTYNAENYQDTIKKVSSTNALMSYETFTYYVPYNFIQKYAVYNGDGNILKYYLYDVFGNVTDSLITKITQKHGDNTVLTENTIAIHNQSINLRIETNCKADISIVSLTGKKIYQIRQSLQTGYYSIRLPSNSQIADGVYFLRGYLGNSRINKIVQSLK